MLKIPSSQIKNSASGFTLIEVIMVMGLMAVVAGLTAFFSLDDYRAYAFRGERDLIVNVLTKARGQAMSNVCLGSPCTEGKAHGVRVDEANKRYIIFQETTYTEGAATNEIISSEQAITASCASSPCLTDIVFSQLSGRPVPASWAVTLSDNYGHSSVISINSEGRIEW